MKSKVFLSMVVVALMFIQQVTAQEVSRILQDKEKRQMLYSTILNNETRFQEFLEATKAAGRANEFLSVLNNETDEVGEAEIEAHHLEAHPAVADAYEFYENQEVMDQMVLLMKELVAKDPEFQKVINEKCPQMGKAMRSE